MMFFFPKELYFWLRNFCYKNIGYFKHHYLKITLKTCSFSVRSRFLLGSVENNQKICFEIVSKIPYIKPIGPFELF